MFCLLGRLAVVILVALLIALIVILLGLSQQIASAAECRMAPVTAFSAEDFPGLTADGTHTSPNVGLIVAGGSDYRLGQEVWVEGIGTLRVADRGHLRHDQLDLLVATRHEAITWGRRYLVVCG